VAETTGQRSGPVFPPGRYGRRRDPRRQARRLPVALAVAGALLGLLVAGVLFVRHGNPPYRPTVVGYELTDDHATVRLKVHKPAGRASVCHVRALRRDGVELGSADVALPDGTDVEASQRFATSARAGVVQVTGCGTPGALGTGYRW